MLTVIVKEPHKKPYIKEMEDLLENYQNIVGGYIEIFPFHNCLAICNEEGKFNNFKPNFPLYNKNGEVIDIVVGNVIFINEREEGEFDSLSNEQIEDIINYFQ